MKKAIEIPFHEYIETAQEQLRKATRGIKITEKIYKGYFGDLNKLLTQFKWGKLEPWSKYVFFRGAP